MNKKKQEQARFKLVSGVCTLKKKMKMESKGRRLPNFEGENGKFWASSFISYNDS